MNNLERVDLLTEEVERFLKQQGDKTKNGSYNIPKDVVIESIIDATPVRNRKGDLLHEYNFLLKRLNIKFHDMANSVNDLSSKEDVFSEIVFLMLEQWEHKETINISFDDYTNIKDDISKILFLIDTRVKGNVLEYNNLEYSRKAEDEESKKYFSRYGRDLIWLDEVHEFNGDEVTMESMIGEDRVINKNHDAKEAEQNLDLTIEKIQKSQLTSKQKEFLLTWLDNGFNNQYTMEDLQITKSGFSKMLNRIRCRLSGHSFTNENKNYIDELNELISYGNKHDIADYIKKNINNADIQSLIYNNTDIKNRQKLIRYINGKDNYCKCDYDYIINITKQSR